MWRLLVVFSTVSIDKIIVFLFFGLWMVLYNLSEFKTNCDIRPEAQGDI